MSTSTIAPPKLRVAVASKGYGLVNQHFGHAREFLIYDVENNQAELIEYRSVSQYCHGKDDTAGDLTTIIDALFDCQAVLVSKIGVAPQSRLKTAGIEVVQVYDAIETAVFDYYNQWIAKNEGN